MPGFQNTFSTTHNFSYVSIKIIKKLKSKLNVVRVDETTNIARDYIGLIVKIRWIYRLNSEHSIKDQGLESSTEGRILVS